MQYNDMSKEELLALKESLNKEYAEAKAKGLALDMSRGKPSAKQLDVSLGLLDTINSSSDLKALDGTDCRKEPGVQDDLPRSRSLQTFYPGNGKKCDIQRKLADGIYAISGRNQSGNLTVDLRVSDDDLRPDRNGCIQCICI